MSSQTYRKILKSKCLNAIKQLSYFFHWILFQTLGYHLSQSLAVHDLVLEWEISRQNFVEDDTNQLMFQTNGR